MPKIPNARSNIAVKSAGISAGDHQKTSFAAGYLLHL
jgi:hypothetical protein